MPLYEYQCISCHKIHEVMQRFSDPPLTECPSCKGIIKKLISLSSFSLKGTGWYVTDYKGKNSSTKVPPGEPKTETEKKPDSKPEVKPEKKDGKPESKSNTPTTG